MLLSVKSTRHSYAGKSICDGGLTVDLSRVPAAFGDNDERLVRLKQQYES